MDTADSDGLLSRRRLLGGTSGALATALAGCGGSGGDGTTTTTTDGSVPEGGTLVVGSESDVDTLDPHRAESALAWEILYNVCETLLTFEDGELTGRLVDDWTVDGETYTFELTPGVQFHPPVDRELVADDVVFSFERMRHEQSGMYGDLRPLSDVTAVDDHTVEMTLSEPFGPFSNFLARVPWAIVPPEAVEDGNDGMGVLQEPVGTGPFQFGERVPGDHVTLEAFDGFRADGVPHLDAVKFTPVPDADSRVLALRKGDVDVARQVSGKDAPTLEDNAETAVVRQRATSWGQVHVNCEREPWSNPAVRRAVAHVVDRQAIVDAGLYGYGTATWQPFPEGSAWHVEDPSRREKDVERAKQILADAGDPLEGETLVVKSTSAYQMMESTAEVLQANLTEAGIDARVESVEWTTMLSDFLDGNFGAMAFSVPFKIDPDRHYYPFLAPEGPGYSHYGPEQPDAERIYELCRQGRRQTDPEARRETYAELQALVDEHCPWISVAFGDGLLGRRASVAGYTDWLLPYTRYWTMGKGE